MATAVDGVRILHKYSVVEVLRIPPAMISPLFHLSLSSLCVCYLKGELGPEGGRHTAGFRPHIAARPACVAADQSAQRGACALC